MDDLRWLRESGMEARIVRHASRGGAVLGICGGYQMLGEEVSDPGGVEGGGAMRGLGLLPAKTVFFGEKTRTQVSGVFEGAEGVFAKMRGVRFEGYEIQNPKIKDHRLYSAEVVKKKVPEKTEEE